jgi:hypothetical protein
MKRFMKDLLVVEVSCSAGGHDGCDLSPWLFPNSTIGYCRKYLVSIPGSTQYQKDADLNVFSLKISSSIRYDLFVFSSLVCRRVGYKLGLAVPGVTRWLFSLRHSSGWAMYLLCMLVLFN